MNNLPPGREAVMKANFGIEEAEAVGQPHQGRGTGRSVPENYERFFVPTIGAPLADDLIAAAALRPGERVLDVACGTGVVARRAARAVGNIGSVAGLDVNPGMLAVARSTTPPDTPIQWHEADAGHMPLADGSFDVVLCQMGLQFMPDRQAALREMRRVLADGGRLILNLPGPTPRLFTAMGEGIARHVGAEAAGFVGLVFSLHDTAEIHGLLDDAGFREVSVESTMKTLRLPGPAAFLWQYVQGTPLAGVMAQVDDERRTALEREIVTGWQEFVEDEDMLLQVRMVTAGARK